MSRLFSAVSSLPGVILANAGAWFAAITARQEQVEWWLRVLATLAALVLSLVSIAVQLRKRRPSDKLKGHD